jgi:hypothetical protein
VTELEQAKADAQFLREALNAGPSRYDQMTTGIYDIYRRWGFDEQTKSVLSATVTLAQAIENGERLKVIPLPHFGFDPAKQGADYTATAKIDESGQIKDVRFG